MIFSAQGLLNANNRVPAEGSGASGPANAPAKAGAAATGAPGIDFPDLLAGAADAGAAKSKTGAASGNKKTAGAGEVTDKQLLDFLRSLFSGGVVQAGKTTGEVTPEKSVSTETKAADILDTLQAEEGNLVELMQAALSALQNAPPGRLDDAVGASEPDVLGRLRAFLSAAGNNSANVLGRVPEDRPAHRQADGWKGREVFGKTADQNSPHTKDQTAFRAARGLHGIEVPDIRPDTAGAANASPRGAGSTETGALGRLRAFLSEVGAKDPAAGKGPLSEGKENVQKPDIGVRDEKAGAGEQNRKVSAQQHAVRLFKAPDSRGMYTEAANPAAEAGETRDKVASGRTRTFAAAAGEKDPDGVKAVLSGMKKGLQNPAKASPQMVQPMTKPPNADQTGHEPLEAIRAATGGGERSQASTISMRPPSGSFDRQIQVEENRLVNQVSLRLSTGVRQGARSMTINLHPPELGSVKVRIVSEGNSLHVHLHSQNHQVAGIIERHLPGLHQSLMDQGVSVTDLQVNVDAGDDRGGSQFEEQGFGDPGRHMAAGEPTSEDEAAGAAPEPEPGTAARGRESGLSLRV